MAEPLLLGRYHDAVTDALKKIGWVRDAGGRIGGRRPKLTAEEWAQAGRLIAAGESRKRVAIIYDVGVSTLYKKFPARC